MFEKDAWEVHGKHFRLSFEKKKYFEGNAIDHNLATFTRSADKAATENADCLISGEAIYHLSEDGMISLREFLMCRFDKITILAFARAPLEFARSYAQEALKYRRTFKDFLVTPPLPNYKKRIGKYVSVFGQENMIVRPFSRALFPQGSVLREVLRMVGVQAAESINNKKQEEQNPSMSLFAARLISSINENMRHLSYDQFNQKFLKPLRNIDGPPFILSREITDKVIDLCQDDLQWLRSTFDIDFNEQNTDIDALPPHSSLTSFSSQEVSRILYFLTMDQQKPS